MQNEPGNWSLVCHLDYGSKGAVAVISHRNGQTQARSLPQAPASGRDALHRPVFLGATADGCALLMDPASKKIEPAQSLPADVIAHYAYPEAGTDRLWYTNDGDEENGNDLLNCGPDGASMTIVEQREGAPPAILKTLCVGRGHHVPTFTAPSAAHPGVPRRAYVSNLLDGTVSVIGNDPRDAGRNLSILGVIDLCEPDKEKDGRTQAPNNAFPHGQVYSPVTGRIYSLNNGYQTIAVIDPVSNKIERRIPFKGASNLLLSPDGRFVIGKGADRKADPQHVIGRIAVLDARSCETVVGLDLQDIYPSTYRFSPDGHRLYVTTAATGKGAQHANLKKDLVLVYDTSALPEIELIREVRVGVADCGRRPIAFLVDAGLVHRVFVPNPTDGTLTILDGVDDRPIEQVKLSEESVEELNFSLLGARNIYGC